MIENQLVAQSRKRDCNDSSEDNLSNSLFASIARPI